MNENLKGNLILSHYRIISKIGKGGMGEVYLAEDTKLDRRVALKILPSEFATDKERMSRFVCEAKSAAALNHQNNIMLSVVCGQNRQRHARRLNCINPRRDHFSRFHAARIRVSSAEFLSAICQPVYFYLK